LGHPISQNEGRSMKITHVVQSGIAAALRPSVVEAKDLSHEDAAHLATLVTAAKTEKPTRREGTLRETIQIEDQTGSVELDQPITNMSPAFRALRSWLKDHPQKMRYRDEQ
jgi:hypothetical protein